LDAEGGGVVNAIDLGPAEQTNVRTALKFLRARCGTWAVVAKAVRFGESTISEIAAGRRAPGPVLAFRVARFVKVSVDDVLAGRFPAPGTCPNCGHRKDDAA
jgi:DNA-binding XRE family transcriptional regulator